MEPRLIQKCVEGRVTIVKALISIPIVGSVPPVISFSIGGMEYVVRLSSQLVEQGWRHGPQQGLGFLRPRTEVEDDGLASNLNSNWPTHLDGPPRMQGRSPIGFALNAKGKEPIIQPNNPVDRPNYSAGYRAPNGFPESRLHQLPSSQGPINARLSYLIGSPELSSPPLATRGSTSRSPLVDLL